MNQNNFILRKFKNIETNEIVDFEEVVNNSNISVILGEPASGKTYQLENYEENSENASLLEPIYVVNNLVTENEEILLFDSIDEALTKYPNIEDELWLYIINNKNKKFVITCRYLEWKEKFEEKLKKIDKTLKVYEIVSLSEEEIDDLLKEEDRKDFWNFIDSNHLESLLKNIVIILHLIDDFRKEDYTNNSYITIYKKIVEKYITERGKYREKQNTDKGLEELVPIASSLATYMTLNRLSSIISSSNIAEECYKINDKSDTKSIVEDDLTAILKTALFKEKGDEVHFFHKSIQEYLTAYFINYKELDFEKIKKIFAHKLRFYEEFEEVIIYLTNMDNNLFDDIVDFDPFIFRRHPSLTKEQQKQLLISTLNKMQNEEWMIDSPKGIGRWSQSRWKILNGSSIFKYHNLTGDEIYKIIKDGLDTKPISMVVFTFLIKLIEFNSSKKLEDFLFFQLEKGELSEQGAYIIHGFVETGTFVKEFYFNEKLFRLIDKKGISYYYNNGDSKMFMFTFFQSLYVQNKNIDFELIPKIFKWVPVFEFRNVFPYLSIEDIRYWLKYKQSDFEYCHHLEWFIVLLLKTKLYSEEIINALEKNPSLKRLQFKRLLNLKNIDKNFFNLLDKKEEKYHNILCRILSFYKLSKDDVEKLIKNYPIKDFLNFYNCLSEFRPIITNRLEQDESYRIYRERQE